MTPAGGDPDPTLPTSHPAPRLVTHQEGQLPRCYGDSRLQGPGGGEGPATAAAALEARVEKGSQNLGPSSSQEPQWTTPQLTSVRADPHKPQVAGILLRMLQMRKLRLVKGQQQLCTPPSGPSLTNPHCPARARVPPDSILCCSTCHSTFFLSLLHHEAQGILIPQPGIDPRPLQWKFRVLTTGLPGKSLCF